MAVDRFAAAREFSEQQRRIRRWAWGFSAPSLLFNVVAMFYNVGALQTFGTGFADSMLVVAALAAFFSLFTIPCLWIGAIKDFRLASASTRVLLVVLNLLALVPVTLVMMYAMALGDLS